MRIREENCNMVLLAAVTLFSTAVAGGATLLGFTGHDTVRLTDRTTNGARWTAPPDKQIDDVAPLPVRLVGAPFVPNTRPRER